MASDLLAVSAAIEAHFKTEWEDLHGDVPVEWEGVNFDPPNGPWVRFRILWGDAFEATMGGSGTGTNDVVGVVSVALFDLPGNGGGEIQGYADEVRTMFNRASIGSAEFGAASGPKAPKEREGWLQTTIDVPFTVNETI